MDRFSYVHQWHGSLADKGFWHSFELPDGTVIQGVHDLDAQKRRLARFPIPADLRGKRVLDIGAWDGWFSFELERRGAEVVAIDRWENPRFWEIRRLMNSRVDYREMDVYELRPDRIGTFDIVLFLGVLYHVRDPLLALERVCSVCRDTAFVESLTLKDHTDRNLLEFFENDELGGQFDNWFVPTPNCLAAMCRAAGFARVETNAVHEFGAALTCRRLWESLESRDCRLLAAAHADNFGVNFHTDLDEYVACVVEGEPPLQPTVGPYAAHPIFAGRTDAGYWQVNFKLPPGLPPGWHPVRLGDSNAVEIAVDLPARADTLSIADACDGVAWTNGRVSLAAGHLTLWARGLPRNADVHNVKLRVDGDRQRVTYVGVDGQINARVSAVSPGRRSVTISCGDTQSAAFPVDFDA